MTTEETKKCPMCAEVIMAAALKCKHCGQLLDGSGHPPSVPTIAPTQATSTKKVSAERIMQIGAVLFAALVLVGLFAWERRGSSAVGEETKAITNSPPPVAQPSNGPCPSGQELREEEFADDRKLKGCSEKDSAGHYIKQGKWVSYYDNGEKEEQMTYKDDKLEGPAVTWFRLPIGQKQSETFYVDGKPEGRSTDWYYNGQVERETNYKAGEIVGVVTTWDENGKKASELQWKDGKQGAFKSFK